MTWLLYAGWMSLAYGAGRFLEASWLACVVAVLVGLFLFLLGRSRRASA